MQGVEAAPTPRQAWAAINAGSPPAESEDRKYNPSQAYSYQGNYHQSPGQNSNPPSLISPSNGESTPGINSPYTQPYHPTGQQPPIHNYAPVNQHTLPMAPPGPHSGMQSWSQQPNEDWIGHLEGIRMNAYFDNLAQQEYPIGMSDGLPPEFPDGSNQNYITAIYGPPTQTWG
jgi:hypothetical protein